MNRRQKIIVSVVGIFLVLLILVGLTYAYFLTKIQGNTKSTSITVKTANLALVYGDGNGIIEPTDPIVPGDTIASKTFTVTNNGDSIVNDYVVVLENVYNELSRPEDLVYTVECTSSDEKGCNGVSTETQFPIGKGSVGAGEGFGIVVTNSIDKDVVHTYTITLKYLNVDVDQSDDMNKTIQGKINIKDGNEINPYKSQEGTLANAIINNAVNLTSEQKENGYAEFRTTPLTTPAVEISSENESEITMANDDYGTSYYYRGNVKNNYLTFNNMCWRVVRIEGDGSIKIVLADASAGCSEDTTVSDSALIGTGDYGYIQNDNDQYFADYENSANRTSSMKYKFNVFLNGGSFTSYGSGGSEITKTYTAWSEEAKSKLKTTSVCMGDITNAFTEEGTLLSETEKQNTISNGENYFYKDFMKLYLNKNVSYVCDVNGTRTSETQIFPLTVDEVVYAGGMLELSDSSNTNTTYYLYDNSTGNKNAWLLLSLGGFSDGMSDNVFYFYHTGYLLPFDSYVCLDYFSLRPAVSLKVGTKIAGGDGSMGNPYVVE